MLSRPNSVLSESADTNDVIDLMYKLMEYRNQEIRHRLEKVGRAASMLHLDVLLLIYHFAKFGTGNILEIAPTSAALRLLPLLERVSLTRQKKSSAWSPEVD